MQNINKSEFKDVNNSTINYNVTQIVDNLGYEKDKQLLKTTKKYFAKLMPSDEDYLSTSKTINELESSIELYEKTLRDTAKILEQAKDDKDLDSVRQFISNGNIEQARDWFDDNKESLFEDEQRLNAKRQAISNKFLIWASLTQTNYDNPNRFADTCSYFERSINAFANKKNVFSYASFLHEHNIIELAELFYQRYLNDFKDEISDENKALVFHNLAFLNKQKGNHSDAFNQAQQAFGLFQQLSEINPQMYMPFVARIMNLTGIIQQDSEHHDHALTSFHCSLETYKILKNEYFIYLIQEEADVFDNISTSFARKGEFPNAELYSKKALDIREQFIKNGTTKDLECYIGTLSNLSIIHRELKQYSKSQEECEICLAIYKKLTEENPYKFLPLLAETYNTLSNLQVEKKELTNALGNLRKSFNIRKSLLKNFSKTHSIYFVISLLNLSLFFLKQVPKKDKSIKYATHALEIVVPMIDQNPIAKEYFNKAVNVLRFWKLNKKQIQQLITDSENQKT
jgi:Tetratricopeptide repeat